VKYLQRLASLHTLPAPTAAERELQSAMHTPFLLRPLPLSSITIEHERDIEATMRVRVAASSSEALRTSPDLQAFAAWAADGRHEDFLWATPRAAALEQFA
jgi:hypothetical protein